MLNLAFLILELQMLHHEINICFLPCLGGRSLKIVRNGLLAGYAEEHGLELGSSCLIGIGKLEALLEQGIYYLAAEKL